MVSAKEAPLVCIVDDDASVRKFTAHELAQHRYRVRSYASANELLAEFDDSAISCIITDLRMPEVDGVQLQRRLNELGSVVSLVVLTGYADVPTTVEVMEKGALTLLEKPYHPDALIAAVERAVVLTEARRARRDAARAVLKQFEDLSGEERDVLDGMMEGLPNKAIAWKLSLSIRTVERRRQQVLAKMQVQSPAELAMLIARIRAEPT